MKKVKKKSPLCYLRKYDGNPFLLIVCFNPGIEKSWLQKIENEIIINDGNVRYNFRILPVENKEKIDYSKEGSAS